MKNILFQEVGMKNFGPYIEPMVLTFENSKVTMLVGPNGVGKTMSLDSIPFTLFGITSKGVKGDEVVNNKKKKDCHTWVKFKVNDDQYTVNRYQKHKELGNTVILNLNGTDIKKGHKEVLPEIEKIICPAKTFMNTLMFGQKVKDFFTDLTDSDKKEIFRKLLGLDNYVLYYNQAKKEIDASTIVINELKSLMTGHEVLMKHLDISIEQDKLKKQDFEKEKAIKLKKFEEEFSVCNSLLKKLENDLKTYENIEERMVEIRNELINVNEKLRTIDQTLNAELQSVSEKAKAKDAEITTVATAESNKIKVTAIEKETEVKNESNKEFEDLEDKNSVFNKRFNELFQAKTNLESQISSLEREIYRLNQNKLEGTCPTCFQTIGEEFKTKIEDLKLQALAKIDEFKKQLKPIEVEQISIDDELKQIKRTKEILKKDLELKIQAIKQKETVELDELRNRLRNAKDTIKQMLQERHENIKLNFQNDKIEYENQISKLTTTRLSIEQEYREYKALQEKINSTKTNLAIISNNHRQLGAQQYDSKEEQLKEELTKVEQKIVETNAKLFQVNRYISLCEFWKDAYSPSGIPAMLVDEAIPFMNRKMGEYLDHLTNGRYVVSFDTVSTTKSGEYRDKISVNLLDTYTQSNTRGQFSGGQTRIVDIATILTLGDLQANIQNMFVNILLFDEIFDSLDAENISNVAKVLNKIKKDKSIYIISHTHQDGIEVDELLNINS